jgi:hypothetical protein
LNRRRLVAAVFFSLVILGVLGVIVGAEVETGGESVGVLRLNRNVPQGALFSSSDVDVVPLRISTGDLNYVTPGSVPAGSRYAVALQTGDLLQRDDILSGDTQIPISLTVSESPPLTAGELIDLFAGDPGSSAVMLIGHDLPIQQVESTTVTVLVSSRDELAWLEVMTAADASGSGAAALKLYALPAAGAAPSGAPPPGITQALCELSPNYCSDLAAPVAGAGMTPAPTRDSPATTSTVSASPTPSS